MEDEDGGGRMNLLASFILHPSSSRLNLLASFILHPSIVVHAETPRLPLAHCLRVVRSGESPERPRVEPDRRRLPVAADAAESAAGAASECDAEAADRDAAGKSFEDRADVRRLHRQARRV